jgi:hypothetical protein
MIGSPQRRRRRWDKAGEASNCWNHAAEKRRGRLNKSAAKEGEMLAKPDYDGVLAAAGFSTRADMQKTNRFQMLKKEQRVLDDCIAAFGPVRTSLRRGITNV